MIDDEKYIKRCIELAENGLGNVAPNPMVGCVIVNNGNIIGEGYHMKYGEPHAEVNAINSVKDKNLLKNSTLYVNLEPCCHFGKTPPCTDLILKHKIPKVLIGTSDCCSKVNCKGIEKLIKSGVDVKTGILENECRDLNKRFFTFHEKKRPYIFLKWAQTSDGFMDAKRTPQNIGSPIWINDELTRVIVHKWRSEEQAIIIGRITAINDNPKLTTREWKGKNPLRIVIDKNLVLPENLNIFDNFAPTIVFTSVSKSSEENTEYVPLDFSKNVPGQIIKELFKRNIQSLIVEGGKILLESFIKESLWDEACILVGNKNFVKGLKTPEIKGDLISENISGKDKLYFYKNKFVV
ncbi:MAG: bifunctional diaminohydroxyphosphoribosylaminopyrimidine deaminase/5-amino-6-(5-phosphoribosylamino)uracil reductase RibD [Bacteroidales bacterium]|nr:bifunctional diaminohydroxyphosphoribosylaminopyrimidine deaminase/5-amino-6-(5-phosphoribosylamino)uracil reductase RibD [Bacteroidales bacterium]